MMTQSPLDQDEMVTLEAEYREALQRLLAAHMVALECEKELADVMRRAEAVLGRVRREAEPGMPHGAGG
jgi:hypothetical protein